MTKYWVAVACAEHVRIGRAQGFMQVNHGKAAPLKRINRGDRVAYYSPTEVFRGTDKLQSFTAVGAVRDGESYQGDMGGDFKAFRRDVAWSSKAKETPIRPLLEHLAFTAGKSNWGYQLRFGLFEIIQADMRLITEAMGGHPA